MKSNKFTYKDNSEFNAKDTYEFKNSLDQTLTSKAVFSQGYWWFLNRYKASSVPSRVKQCW